MIARIAMIAMITRCVATQDTEFLNFDEQRLKIRVFSAQRLRIRGFQILLRKNYIYELILGLRIAEINKNCSENRKSFHQKFSHQKSDFFSFSTRKMCRNLVFLLQNLHTHILVLKFSKNHQFLPFLPNFCIKTVKN